MDDTNKITTYSPHAQNIHDLMDNYANSYHVYEYFIKFPETILELHASEVKFFQKDFKNNLSNDQFKNFEFLLSQVKSTKLEIMAGVA
jgi:hypothetical protein